MKVPFSGVPMLTRRIWCLCILFVSACGPAPVNYAELRPHAFDWPQWRGPDRTAKSPEKGLLARWPKSGPPLVWKAKRLGGGYSTPSVASGRVFGMSFRGNDEVVWALEEASGQELWHTRIAEAKRNIGYGEGPRCTPTIDGDFLYALGVNGDLVCLDIEQGKEHWRKNLPSDFHGSMMSGWGYSESPLVDGDRLIVTPGGREATLVALDKKTGETIWKAQVPDGGGAGYASAIKAQLNGGPQYVQFLGRGVVGVAATDGKFLWRYKKPANLTANCATPIAQNDCVFAASDYGTGGGLFCLGRQDDKTAQKEIYFTKHMQNHHGGMVLVDGYLYGADQVLLTCLEFKTGKVMWAERSAGKGSIAYADGHLYYRQEGGPIILAESNPKEYVECGRFQHPDRSGQSAWPHPVIANGKLFIRDQDVLLCYNVKRPEPAGERP
jgi:outer membrane protein assembly factor BamB